MRVCALVYSFYEMDSRVLRCTEVLAKRGDHVDAIALRQPGTNSYEVIKGVHVYRIQGRLINEKTKLTYAFRILRFLFHSAWILTKLQMRGRYDLIHVHSVPDFEVFAALVPKLFGAKIILDIHDIVPEFFVSKFSKDNRKGLLFNLLIWAEKLSILFSDHVIVSNDIWKQRLESRSASPEKCTSLLNYVDGARFCKREKPVKQGRFIILYPGSLNWHQGLDIAVEAFSKIKDKVPDADFHIYGEGSAKSQLAQLIDNLGLKDRVFLFPLIPWGEVATIISDADIGIIPKRNDQFGGEAFSTKTLEFMSAGVPIIVSRTTIDQYYFNDSVVKFFEPENIDDLADAILALVNDPSMRERFARNGMEYAKKNNWEEKKEVYLNLVDALCRGKNPRDKGNMGNSDKGQLKGAQH